MTLFSSNRRFLSTPHLQSTAHAGVHTVLWGQYCMYSSPVQTSIPNTSVRVCGVLRLFSEWSLALLLKVSTSCAAANSFRPADRVCAPADRDCDLHTSGTAVSRSPDSRHVEHIRVKMHALMHADSHIRISYGNDKSRLMTRDMIDMRCGSWTLKDCWHPGSESPRPHLTIRDLFATDENKKMTGFTSPKSRVKRLGA